MATAAAVIAQENDNSMVSEPQVINRLQQTSQVLVGGINGPVISRLGKMQTLSEVFIDVRVGNLKGSVGGVISKIKEEGTILVLIDEVDGAIGEDVGAITARLHGFVVGIQLAVRIEAAVHDAVLPKAEEV